MSDEQELDVTGAGDTIVEPDEVTTPPVESDEVIQLRKENAGLKSAVSADRHKRQIAEGKLKELNQPQAPPSSGNDPEAINRAVGAAMEQRDEQARQTAADQAWTKQIEQGQKDHADVDIAQIINDPSFYQYFNQTMSDVVKGTGDGVDLMLHLHANRDVLQQIAQLSPVQAAQQMGRLSEQIKASATPKVSNASEPIDPVDSRSVSEKKTDDMSVAEYDTYIRELNGGSVFPR